MKIIAFLLVAPLWAQQPATSHNPDSARLVSSDIGRFWRVFDRVPHDSASLRTAGPLFQHSYIDSGTVGLQDFVPHRIESGERLAAEVASHRQYYAAIRASTLAVDTATRVKDAIRTSFRRLATICPEAFFPNVYLVIGAMSSGGTTSDHGMLIGVEMNARDDHTPIDELGAWHRAVIGRIADLPYLVAHELIHIQQGPKENVTVLSTAMREGGADFVGELISGGMNNHIQHNYGDAHEEALKTEFSRAIDSGAVRDWFFQGDKSKDRPPDLGYYEGHRIAQAYYRRAGDKREATCTIMHAANPEDLLRRSGYLAEH